MTEQTTDTGQVARWARREPLLLLLLRLTRGKLTPAEAPQLRTAVEAELTDAEAAHRRAERAEQLLTEYVRLADVTHTYGAMGGHDRLGANFACVGCQLRDRARTALDSAQQPGPAAEREVPPCG